MSYSRMVSEAIAHIQRLIDEGYLEGILRGEHNNEVIPGLGMTMGQVLESYQRGCEQTGAHNPLVIVQDITSRFPTEASRRVAEHLIARVAQNEVKAQVGAIENVLQDAKLGITSDQVLASYRRGCTRTGAHDPLAILRRVASCFPTEAEQEAQYQANTAPGQDPFDGVPSVTNPFTTRESVERLENEVRAQLDTVRCVIQDATLNLARAGAGAMVLTGTTFVIAERLDNNRGGRRNAVSDGICLLIALRSFPMLLAILIPAAEAPVAVSAMTVTGAAIVGQYAVRRLLFNAAAPAAAGPVPAAAAAAPAAPAFRLPCTLL